MNFPRLSLVVGVAAVIGTGTGGPSASGQDTLPQKLHQSIEQANALTGLFEAWNDRRLRLDKQQFSDLFQGEIERAEMPADWKARRQRQWEQLPNALEARAPLTSGASLVLLGLYEDNREAFAQAEIADRDRYMLSKLYFILGEAQQTATRQGSEQIKSSHILTAVQSGWCGIWPFCLKEAQP
jgi:hypothetical protein